MEEDLVQATAEPVATDGSVTLTVRILEERLDQAVALLEWANERHAEAIEKQLAAEASVESARQNVIRIRARIAEVTAPTPAGNSTVA